MSVVVLFPVVLIEYPNKSSFREEGLVLAHHPGDLVQSIMTRKHWPWDQGSSLCVSAIRKQRDGCTHVLLDSNERRMVLPTYRVDRYHLD